MSGVCPVPAEAKHEDFITAAVSALAGDLFARRLPGFTHAIMNPPYKKIRSDSPHRADLHRVGIETVNLYSAFVGLELELLEDGGQLVAIIPRSFCNGPYYRPFRDLLLSRSAIRHIHLFHSRNKAFSDDNVLQENVIVLLERGARQTAVKVSTSTDASFRDYSCRILPFSEIVLPGDSERFIHVPGDSDTETLLPVANLSATLEDLDITVSTGPIVDFRLRKHLLKDPVFGSVPLLYPGHFSGKGVEWPKQGFRKHNAIVHNDETEKWLFPAGYYTVVRRFSSKEEKRRIVASVVDISAFPNIESFGFENHLNVFCFASAGTGQTPDIG